MAKHEFGIMQKDPQNGQRFDDYEPDKYDCITVDDELVEVIYGACVSFDSFCHTVDIPMSGLNYCGVTLIPPRSLDRFISVVSMYKELEDLKNLLTNARNNNRFIIHFGI